MSGLTKRLTGSVSSSRQQNGKGPVPRRLEEPIPFWSLYFQAATVRPRRLIETARHPIDTAKIKSINGSGTS
jgi:hypothetical protein